MNMSEGQRKLDRQRYQRQPASEPQSPTNPCHVGFDGNVML
jgi:hypothetical protein